MFKPEITGAQRELMTRYVRELLGTEKARMWWMTPNPMLGGVSPMWMRDHNESKLYRFILDAHANNRAALTVGAEHD